MPDPAQVAARVARWDTDGPQGPMTRATLGGLDCAFCDTTDRHRPPVNDAHGALAWIVDEAAAPAWSASSAGRRRPLVRRAPHRRLPWAKSHGMEGILTTNGTL